MRTVDLAFTMSIPHQSPLLSSISKGKILRFSVQQPPFHTKLSTSSLLWPDEMKEKIQTEAGWSKYVPSFLQSKHPSFFFPKRIFFVGQKKKGCLPFLSLVSLLMALSFLHCQTVNTVSLTMLHGYSLLFFVTLWLWASYSVTLLFFVFIVHFHSYGPTITIIMMKRRENDII